MPGCLPQLGPSNERSIEMMDQEIVARAIARAEAGRRGYGGPSIETYIEGSWPRWIPAATAAIDTLDGERLRRALYAKGDITACLVTVQAARADAAAYKAVLAG